MSKQNYTHSLALLPKIEEMIAAGKSQCEAAEHFGFRDKYLTSFPIQTVE